MSDYRFAPDWAAKVTIPVKRVGDKWEFFYGGDIPVRDGALGELTLSGDQITDAQFKQRVMQELSVKVLDEGAELLVALSDHNTGQKLAGHWPWPHPWSVPAGTTRLEKIRLGPVKRKLGEVSLDAALERGGLWLKLKGLERCELHASTVVMPDGFHTSTAASLNHAFTLLSEVFEKHRISHTGNVYSRVFYREPTGQWFPLDDLRRGVRADAERSLLHSTWTEVERVLGWRPLRP